MVEISDLLFWNPLKKIVDKSDENDLGLQKNKKILNLQSFSADYFLFVSLTRRRL